MMLVTVEGALLLFPNLDKLFDLHIDVSNYHIEGAIYQERKLVWFFSRKLSVAHDNSRVTEKEILVTVES